MINNPQNIENDIVLAHGRWCLDKCMTAEGAKRLALDSPIYAENEQRIQSLMDQRRADLIANKVAYCENEIH
jgi:hypothetical protein